MDTRERARLKEIDRILASDAARYKMVYAEWSKLNAERKELDADIKRLFDERDKLVQGQLIFAHAV